MFEHDRISSNTDACRSGCELCELERRLRALDNLWAFIGYVAGLAWAYDIGQDMVRLDRAGWYPGCGFEATQALLACEWCGEFYAAARHGDKRATDCAASTFKRDDGNWYLAGHYGSRGHDMRLYRFVARAHPYEERAFGCGVDPVCDRCIDQLLADGLLIPVDDDYLPKETTWH